MFQTAAENRAPLVERDHLVRRRRLMYPKYTQREREAANVCILKREAGNVCIKGSLDGAVRQRWRESNKAQEQPTPSAAAPTAESFTRTGRSVTVAAAVDQPQQRVLKTWSESGGLKGKKDEEEEDQEDEDEDEDEDENEEEDEEEDEEGEEEEERREGGAGEEELELNSRQDKESTRAPADSVPDYRDRAVSSGASTPAEMEEVAHASLHRSHLDRAEAWSPDGAEEGESWGRSSSLGLAAGGVEVGKGHVEVDHEGGSSGYHSEQEPLRVSQVPTLSVSVCPCPCQCQCPCQCPCQCGCWVPE